MTADINSLVNLVGIILELKRYINVYNFIIEFKLQKKIIPFKTAPVVILPLSIIITLNLYS